MKVLAWYIDSNGIENMETVKYQYPAGTKIRGILIIDTQMISKKKEKKMIADQHSYKPLSMANNHCAIDMAPTWRCCCKNKSLS